MDGAGVGGAEKSEVWPPRGISSTGIDGTHRQEARPPGAGGPWDWGEGRDSSGKNWRQGGWGEAGGRVGEEAWGGRQGEGMGWRVLAQESEAGGMILGSP